MVIAAQSCEYIKIHWISICWWFINDSIESVIVVDAKWWFLKFHSSFDISVGCLQWRQTFFSSLSPPSLLPFLFFPIFYCGFWHFSMGCNPLLLCVLMLELFCLSESPNNVVCMSFWRSSIILKVFLYFMHKIPWVILYFLCSSPEISCFPKKTFGGKWHLKTKIWALHVLIATEMQLVLSR